VILARLDNVFIVAVLGIWILFEGLSISKTFLQDEIIAIAIMLLSYLLRLGLNGRYSYYAVSIYISIFLTMILQPLALKSLHVDRDLIKRKKLVFLLRLSISVLASTLVVAGIVFIASKTSNGIYFSKSVFLVDAVTSVFIFGIVHLLDQKYQTVGKSNFVKWIKGNWKKTLIRGLAFATPILILVGGYLLWNYLTLHTLMPVSGQVKLWWASLPNSVYSRKVNAITFLGLASNPDGGPWSLMMSLPGNIADLLSASSALSQ